MDSSAWIELFDGSDRGKRVREILETKQCYTSIVTLAEVSNWSTKQNYDTKLLMEAIKRGSSIIDLTEDIAILAGEINFERKKTNDKWGMLDSFILATANICGLHLLTKDSDYIDLPNAELL